MGGIKKKYSFELNDDQVTWLQEMVESHSLEDEGKALRVVLDYIKEEANLDDVFKKIRCNHCN